MADIKFGMGQTERPAPLGYRRFSNAFIMFIIPGAIAMISGWGLPDKIANHWLMILGFLPAVIKGVGVLLGNGQYFNPSNQTIDAKNDSSPK